MYPTIFNVVMDASIRHWVTLFTPAEAGIEVFKKTVHDLEVYLYADNGIIALPQTERLQRLFDVLTYGFEWGGLRTNVRKKVIMACHPCHTPCSIWEASCERRNIGIGP